MTDSKVHTLPDMQTAEAEANAWIVRLEDEEASPETLLEFEAWRKKSPLNGEAYERLSRFWGEVEAIEALGDYAESDAAIDGMRHDRIVSYARTGRRVVYGAIAASLAAIVGVNTYSYTFGVNRPVSAEYQTAIGEQETVALPDGSEIILNTDSAIEIAYSRGARTIRLDRGEAYFDVASAKRRPFSVETDKGAVTAVGTAFSVKLKANKLDVVVEEGRVTVSALQQDSAPENSGETPEEAAHAPVDVSAGHTATIGSGIEAISAISADALIKALDWRDGVLSFEGETLEEVIAEISRYTDLEIEIGDEELKRERIVAYYKIGSVERVFEALRLVENVELERVSDTHVRLYRAQPAGL